MITTYENYNNGMFVVELSIQEEIMLRDFVAEEQKQKEINKIKNKKAGKESDFEIAYMGFAGEFVVHKLLGMTYPMNIYIAKDEGYDIVINGLKFDIKTNKRSELSVPDWQMNNKIDGYIYVKSDDAVKQMIVVGIISKKRFNEIAVKKHYVNDMYCVAPEELKSIKLLMNNNEKIN